MVGTFCAIGMAGCETPPQKAVETTERGDFFITLMNVPPDAMQVAVALYREEANYLSEPVAHAGTTPLGPNSGTSATVVFEDILAGAYAIVAIADRDGDGRLAQGLLGVPLEWYGFGNDASGLLGPPSFEKTLVVLEAPKTMTTIHLKRPPFGTGQAK